MTGRMYDLGLLTLGVQLMRGARRASRQPVLTQQSGRGASTHRTRPHGPVLLVTGQLSGLLGAFLLGEWVCCQQPPQTVATYCGCNNSCTSLRFLHLSRVFWGTSERLV
jgi:hypothetical protein